MLALWFLAAAPFYDPDVHFREQVQYYAIKTDSWPQLIEVVRNRPGKGNKAWAQTQWQGAYKLAFASNDQYCWISAMQVTLKVTISLPDWQNVPRDLAPRWQAFFQHIKQHEYLHRQHVIDMIKALKKDVAALPPGPSCPSMKAAYERIKEKRDTERAEKDDALDEKDRLWQIAEQEQALR
ncbi:DUF922 domain-containing protein [Gallaecimonas mangrovi]|uniref:DUF922 domain-containing protein n=1 Tax=Gallaecimonas mangrovi TaxID=2291597 RepID=UPI000E204E4B|nr:DUF922 domain-containing protein [Gallaecimonas mangrovi]